MKKLSVFLVVFFLPIFSLFTSCKEGENITTYEITCELNDNLLTGVEKVKFYNDSENAFKSLKFNLFANAFRKDAKYSPISSQYLSRAYYGGINYGEMNIIRVYGEKNQDLTYNIVGEDKNILEVALEYEVFPEDSVCINIEYSITLAKVVARTGINEKAINLANFYPILCGIQDGAFYECVYYSSGDPYFSDVSNYLVTFICGEEYVVASSGKVIKSENYEGKRKTVYQLNRARDFALTLSKDYEFITEKVNGVEVNYYYINDKSPEKSIKTAVQSMEYFSKTFGEYPYPTYSIVETEFIQGGMEFPALVMISDDLETMAYLEVIAHETAHQWWQTTVGNNEIEYGFLDEGLAEYSVVLFYENYPDYGLNRQMLIESSEKTYKTFCTVYDKLFGKVNTSMTRSLKDFSSEYEYVNIAYVKPCIMYDGLRKSIGDECFFKAIRNYYKNYSFKNATPDQLAGEFEKVVKDSSGYLTSFFEGKAVI